MYDFKDKVVVLTGGSSGMGRCFVMHILGRGGIVSFGDVNTALSRSLLLQIHSSAPRLVSRLLFTKTDIRDAGQVKHLFDRTKEVYGVVDCLLCVAGVNVPDSFLPLPPTKTTTTRNTGERQETCNLLNIEINLSGTINTIYAGLPYLSRDARIVVISSTAGIYPSSVQPLYSASKHGLIGFSRSLAPLLPHSQRIIVLAPSTYLPPHHQATSKQNNNNPPLQMSSGSMQDPDDIFTQVIGETLGFVEMSTILTTLDDALENNETGSVIEITPIAVQQTSFLEAPEKLARMEQTLRDRLCAVQADPPKPNVHKVNVKHEQMDE